MHLTEEVRNEIAMEWRTLEDMVEVARWSWTEVEDGPADFKISRELAISSLNLCVLFAISILERVLLRLRSEGCFASHGSSLYGLMQASRNAGLAWHDFSHIDAIRRQRNALAHKRVRSTEDECLSRLLAISLELEQQAIVSPRKELFMYRCGLNALNINGRRFDLAMWFPPDTEEALRHNILVHAKAVAVQIREPADFEFQLRKALAAEGLWTPPNLLIQFRVEP